MTHNVYRVYIFEVSTLIKKKRFKNDGIVKFSASINDYELFF